MSAKILSAGALTLLLSGGALAYIPQPQQHNIYAGYSNRQQGANNIGQHMRPTPRGMGTLIRRVRTPSAEAQANAM